MVLLTFPNTLTEEEEMLKQKFARLRKKKKQLQALKTKPETQQKPEQTAKRPVESAEVATEQAKKLVQSGAIKVSSGSKDRSGFKRSKHQEKKKESISVGYEQFKEEEDKPDSSKPKPRKALSESFVSAGPSKMHHSDFDGDERRPRDRGSRHDRESRRREPPSKGNTIHVCGEGVTEELLKSAFDRFGNIVNINTEMNKGFVTFEKMESADKAIHEMNNKMVSNTVLEVSMAFKQFNFENMQDPASGGSTWSDIAANDSQKGPARKDTRDLVAYNDDMF